MVQSVRDIVNQSASTIVEMGVCAAVGYLGARVFSIIDPVHAAVFAATTVVVSKVTEPLFEKIFGGSGANEDSKFLGKVLNITACVLVSGAISSVLGFPVSTGAGVAIWLIVLVTRVAINALNEHGNKKHYKVYV